VTETMVLAVLLGAALASVASASDETADVQAWARTALLGEPARVEPLPAGIELRRQDAGELQLRQSVMLTPIQIGTKQYERGLGTHANSEIVVRLDEPGGVFEAEVGVDNNYDTAGQRGTVVFSVEVGGNEVFRSPLHKGGQEPVPVKVELGGAKNLVLRVNDGGDGIGWDQCDWADARVTLRSGEEMWLDEMPLVVPPARLGTTLPFSFAYGDRPSAELLPTWQCTRGEPRAEEGCERHTVTYRDPATGLEVACETTLFSDFPAVEWVLRFTNAGTQDTPILSSIQALDLDISTPAKGDIVLHHSNGSTSSSTDFLPIDTTVEAGKKIVLAPNGGRSSDGVLPFFNLEWQDGGIAGAIGWSGQWEMRLRRDAGRELTVEAGQQTTHMKLLPGESIRTPRILLVLWRGEERLRGHNLLRRVLVAHYLPRVNGQVAMPPISMAAVAQDLNAVTEENTLASVPRTAANEYEVFWLDAGWFEGEWPYGAGSWVPKAAFPRGLKPLGDAAHEHGLRFLLWFDPERVCGDTRIAREHPDWVRWAERPQWGGLYKLEDPQARRWLTDHLAKCIADWGVDIYRNDFNIDPLRFWQAADAPDRQGITENHYVEGLYEMWDELRARKPGLTIDNCAGGGRRIDLETLSRSYPLWRSDTTCSPPVSSAWDQCQTAGLSLYVPLHSAGAWGVDPYQFRSVATSGILIAKEGRVEEKRATEVLARIREVKDLRPFWLGDYYPLLSINLDETQWCAWQFDRPDMNEGFAMFFRRPQSPYTTTEVALRGLEPSSTYTVTFVDAEREITATGAELGKLRVEIPTAPGTMLVRYKRTSR
jgi:alpha-galactosidase